MARISTKARGAALKKKGSSTESKRCSRSQSLDFRASSAVKVTFESPKGKLQKGSDQGVPSLPKEEQWFCAPYFKGDKFWSESGKFFPHGDIAEDALLLDEAGDSSGIAHMPPEKVIRFGIEQGEYPYSSIKFENYVSPGDGMDLWAQEILENRKYRDTLRSANVYYAIKNTIGLKLPRNIAALETFISRWNTMTHTALVAFGEIGPTMEDACALMRLDPFGTVNLARLEMTTEETECHTALCNANKRLVGSFFVKKVKQTERASLTKNTFASWMRCWWKDFADPKTIKGEFVAGEGINSPHHLAAFLVCWLSRFILEGPPADGVCPSVFPLAVKLSFGESVPLAAIFIGTLYHRLDEAREATMRSVGRYNVTSYIPTPFLQMWLYERYPNFAPTPITASEEKQRRQPRSARWVGSCPGKDLASVIDMEEEFRWRPYVDPLPGFASFDHYPIDNTLVEWQDPDNVLNEVAVMSSWLAPRWIPALIDSQLKAVSYSPHRIARQFGYDQGLPAEYGKISPEEVFDILCDAPDNGVDPTVELIRGKIIPGRGRKGRWTAEGRQFWYEQLGSFGEYVRSKPLRINVPVVFKNEVWLSPCNSKRRARSRGVRSPYAKPLGINLQSKGSPEMDKTDLSCIRSIQKVAITKSKRKATEVQSEQVHPKKRCKASKRVRDILGLLSKINGVQESDDDHNEVDVVANASHHRVEIEGEKEGGQEVTVVRVDETIMEPGHRTLSSQEVTAADCTVCVAEATSGLSNDLVSLEVGVTADVSSHEGVENGRAKEDIGEEARELDSVDEGDEVDALRNTSYDSAEIERERENLFEGLSKSESDGEDDEVGAVGNASYDNIEIEGERGDVSEEASKSESDGGGDRFDVAKNATHDSVEIEGEREDFIEGTKELENDGKDASHNIEIGGGKEYSSEEVRQSESDGGDKMGTGEREDIGEEATESESDDEEGVELPIVPVPTGMEEWGIEREAVQNGTIVRAAKASVEHLPVQPSNGVATSTRNSEITTSECEALFEAVLERFQPRLKRIMATKPLTFLDVPNLCPLLQGAILNALGQFLEDLEGLSVSELNTEKVAELSKVVTDLERGLLRLAWLKEHIHSLAKGVVVFRSAKALNQVNEGIEVHTRNIQEYERLLQKHRLALASLEEEKARLEAEINEFDQNFSLDLGGGCLQGLGL